MNDSIGHVEVGDEAPFVFFAQVCGVGLLYDARNGLVGIAWQWLEKFWRLPRGQAATKVNAGAENAEMLWFVIMLKDDGDGVAQKFL